MLKSIQVFWGDHAKMPVQVFKTSLFEDCWTLAIFFFFFSFVAVTKNKFTDRKKYQSNVKKLKSCKPRKFLALKSIPYWDFRTFCA